jgi:translation initiation factor IF-1
MAGRLPLPARRISSGTGIATSRRASNIGAIGQGAAATAASLLSHSCKARRVPPHIRKDDNVTKEELLEFEGLVTEILPDARYRVQLDNGQTVEVSPYDLEKGRMIFRHKDERAGNMPRPPQRQQFRRR